MCNMHKDISTVYDKLRNITEKCLLDKLEDFVPGGRHARRPGDRLGRELSEPGSRSRSPRGRQGPRSPGARGHSWSSEPEVSSARSTRGTETSESDDSRATARPPPRQAGRRLTVEDLRERLAPFPPLIRDLSAVRLKVLAGRDSGWQTYIGPSFGLHFYLRHIAECLATPVYTEVEWRKRVDNLPRRVLQEMLVAAAFPDSPNEARINRPQGCRPAFPPRATRDRSRGRACMHAHELDPDLDGMNASSVRPGFSQCRPS